MVQPALYQPGGKRQHSGIDSYHEYGAPVERSQRLELFAAQNLTSADNEKMWQAQGRMLTAQSLKINALLQALREQGFDTTAIEQQEQEIPVHYVSKGNWWGGVCNYASNNGNSVSR